MRRFSDQYLADTNAYFIAMIVTNYCMLYHTDILIHTKKKVMIPTVSAGIIIRKRNKM